MARAAGSRPAAGDGQAEGRVVPQERDIVLVPPPLGQRQHPGPHKLHRGVDGPGRIARIRQVPSDQGGQPQPIRKLSHQQHTRVGAEALRPRLDLNRLVAIQPKQRTLNFTHGVLSGSVMKVWSRHPHLISASGDAPWAFCITTVRSLSPS